MRRQDKKKNIQKVNKLFEQRTNDTKFYLNEGVSEDTYFETLSSALEYVRGMAESLGFEVDEEDMWINFGTDGISYGQTKSANIRLLQDGQPILDRRGKEMNRAIHVVIYRMETGRYELTAYKTF